MSQTRSLAEFVARLRYEDLPQVVVEQACRIVADTVGCAISAWAEDHEKSRVAREWHSPQRCRQRRYAQARAAAYGIGRRADGAGACRDAPIVGTRSHCV